MVTVYMIWREMYMNGVLIIGIQITQVTHQSTTRWGRRLDQNECCGADLSSAQQDATSMQTPSGWIAAKTAIRLIGTTTSAFDVSQDCLKK